MSFKNENFNYNYFCDKSYLLGKLFPDTKIPICKTCQNLPEKCENCKEGIPFCSEHECKIDCIRYEDCYCEYCDNVRDSSEHLHSKCEECKLLMNKFKTRQEERLGYVDDLLKKQRKETIKETLGTLTIITPLAFLFLSAFRKS